MCSPFVWVGFVINVITGSLLFIYGATSFGTNGAFLLKMGFMVLAGINALLFDVSAGLPFTTNALTFAVLANYVKDLITIDTAGTRPAS